MIFITTPIFYPNGKPHLGHAYTMVIADVIYRFKKSLGEEEVNLQTGCDEHGKKIIDEAKKMSLEPKKMIEDNIYCFKDLFEKLGVFDFFFYRTSSEEHKKKVQNAFKLMVERGDIYFDKYVGYYCLPCEENLNSADVCLNCKRKATKIEEPAYFLKVTKYFDWLKRYYDSNKKIIVPAGIKESLKKFFDDPKDLCISRNQPELGIDVPYDSKMSIYVWFDALLNYAFSFCGEKSFKNKNTKIIQIIGKDISRFHCIYWPIMLKILSLRLPDTILVHGWIMNKDKKMSKSVGNVIDPTLFCDDRLSLDVLRLYFISEISFLKDGLINELSFKEFNNRFVVNDLGNLVMRFLGMVTKYNDGLIPRFFLSKNCVLLKYLIFCKKVVRSFKKKMNCYQLTKAFKDVEELIKRTNEMINEFCPWRMILIDKEECFLFLNYIANGIKIIGFLLSFFSPRVSQIILNLFSDNVHISWNGCLDFKEIEKTFVKRDFKPFVKT